MADSETPNHDQTDREEQEHEELSPDELSPSGRVRRRRKKRRDQGPAHLPVPAQIPTMRAPVAIPAWQRVPLPQQSAPVPPAPPMAGQRVPPQVSSPVPPPGPSAVSPVPAPVLYPDRAVADFAPIQPDFADIFQALEDAPEPPPEAAPSPLRRSGDVPRSGEVARPEGVSRASDAARPGDVARSGDDPRASAPRRSDQVAALPASLEIVTHAGVIDERAGKRRRKREGEDGGGPRKCPRCNARKAAHVQPKQWWARMLDTLGLHTYSCRACRSQFVALSFIEGPAFTWRQMGIFLLIVAMLVAAYFIVHPLMTRLPDFEEY